MQTQQIDVGNTSKKIIKVKIISDSMSWSIDNKKCLRCGACVGVCPVLALELKEGKIKNDSNKCTLCGICEKVCPVKAIKVEKDVKE